MAMSSAPAPWEPEGGSEDVHDSFSEILDHISRAKRMPTLLRTVAQKPKEVYCQPEWKRISTVGRELDERVGLLGFSAAPARREKEKVEKVWGAVTWAHKAHKDSCFGCFGFMGHLPHRDFNAWDVERLANPERAWPAHGAVSKLYDTKRKGKPGWNPTTWVHKGRCFPLEAPPLAGQGLKVLRRHTQSNPTMPGLEQSDLSDLSTHKSWSATASKASNFTRALSVSSSAPSLPSRSSKGDPGDPQPKARRPSKDRSEPKEPKEAKARAWNIVGEVILD